MDIEPLVGAELLKQAKASGGSFSAPLRPTTPLAATGLDSLGFTTLIIELEQRLGVDPFGGDDEIVYPETFGELVELYRAATRS